MASVFVSDAASLKRVNVKTTATNDKGTTIFPFPNHRTIYANAFGPRGSDIELSTSYLAESVEYNSRFRRRVLTGGWFEPSSAWGTRDETQRDNPNLNYFISRQNARWHTSPRASSHLSSTGNLVTADWSSTGSAPDNRSFLNLLTPPPFVAVVIFVVGGGVGVGVDVVVEVDWAGGGEGFVLAFFLSVFI